MSDSEKSDSPKINRKQLVFKALAGLGTGLGLIGLLLFFCAGTFHYWQGCVHMAMLLIDLSIPLILGSFFAMIPMMFVGLLLVVRIWNEEAMLIESLEGYTNYMKKVRYRLIPYVW